MLARESRKLESEKPNGSRQAKDVLNWSELAFELDLNAVSRQFVLNCIVESYTDKHLILAFLPELEVMLKPDLERQIKQAIEHKLGVSLNLELKSSATLAVETPHQAEVRKQEEERQSMIRSIRQDALVQQLKTVFSAELVEDSVQKRS